MRSRALTRAAAIAVAALTATGGALLAAAPASAATVVVTDDQIRPDATTYAGWHEGYTNAEPAYSTHWDGLRFGTAALSSQIIKGYETPVANPDLVGLVSAASLQVKSGLVSLQLPVFYGPADATPRGFTTLRPAELAGPGTATFTGATPFTASRSFGTIVANEPAPLTTIAAELATQGDVQLLAFGALADAGSPSTLESLTFGGDTYDFRDLAPVVPIERRSVEVLPGDFVTELPAEGDTVPEELVGRWLAAQFSDVEPFIAIAQPQLAAGSLTVPADGIIAHVVDSPIPYSGAQIGNMLRQSGVTLASGLGSLQLQFAGVDGAPAFISLNTLVAGEATFELEGAWGFEGDTLALGDLVELLAADTTQYTFDSFTLFGGPEGAVVTSIALGDAVYSFALVPTVVPGPGITPVGTGPVAELAATGAESALPAGIAGMVLLLGGVLVAVATVRRRAAQR